MRGDKGGWFSLVHVHKENRRVFFWLDDVKSGLSPIVAKAEESSQRLQIQEWEGENAQMEKRDGLSSILLFSCRSSATRQSTRLPSFSSMPRWLSCLS